MARKSMKQFRKRLQEMIDKADVECQDFRANLRTAEQKRDALRAALELPELKADAIAEPRKRKPKIVPPNEGVL